MPHLLFHLHNAPEDEAQDIRDLLNESNITFYETSAGRWKIGVEAIWLPDDEQKAQAKTLLDTYQKKRYQDFTEQRNHLKKQGLLSAIYEKFYAQPLPFLAAVLGIGLVFAISILPFYF